MKKVILLVLCCFLLMACQTKEKTTSKIVDGTYEGKSASYNGEVAVKVIVKDQKVNAIEVTKNDDTKAITKRAFPIMEEKIKKYQSSKVETVSSATFSSAAYRQAVEEAMNQAGFDTKQKVVETAEKVQDTKTNLVIVGGGPSGLTAAIEAK